MRTWKLGIIVALVAGAATNAFELSQSPPIGIGTGARAVDPNLVTRKLRSDGTEHWKTDRSEARASGDCSFGDCVINADPTRKYRTRVPQNVPSQRSAESINVTTHARPALYCEAACSTGNLTSNLHKVSIVGPDNRRDMSSAEARQFSSVCTVYNTVHRYTVGTATLTYDGSSLTTSPHLFYAEGVLVSPISELVVVCQSDIYSIQRISVGTTNTALAKGKDGTEWALIILTTPARGRGRKFAGTMPIDDNNFYKYKEKIINVAYHDDLKAIKIQECSLLGKFNQYVIEHNCDTAEGASGSSLFVIENGTVYTVAIHYKASKSNTTNFATIYRAELDELILQNSKQSKEPL